MNDITVEGFDVCNKSRNTLDEEKFVKSLLDQKKKSTGAALTLKS